MNHKQKGNVALLVLFFVAVAIVGGGWLYLYNTSQEAADAPIVATSTADQNPVVVPTRTTNTSVQPINAEVRDNNVYLRGSLVASNIPAILGLPVSSKGQAYGTAENTHNGFLETVEGANDWMYGGGVGTVDAYSGVKSSSDQTLVAFIYERLERKNPDDFYPKPTFASILTYSPQGFVSRFDLLAMNYDYPKANLFNYPELTSIIYIDHAKIYARVQKGKDADDSLFFEIKQGTANYLFRVSESEVFSVDGTRMAFSPAGENGPELWPCISDLGNSNHNAVRVIDFASGTDINITADTSRFYSIVGWSKDGTSLLVTEGVPTGKTDKGDSCISYNDKVDNFFTYNVVSKVKKMNTSPLPQAYTSACESGGYKCPKW